MSRRQSVENLPQSEISGIQRMQYLSSHPVFITWSKDIKRKYRIYGFTFPKDEQKWIDPVDQNAFDKDITMIIKKFHLPLNFYSPVVYWLMTDELSAPAINYAIVRASGAPKLVVEIYNHLPPEQLKEIGRIASNYFNDLAIPSLLLSHASAASIDAGRRSMEDLSRYDDSVAASRAENAIYIVHDEELEIERPPTERELLNARKIRSRVMKMLFKLFGVDVTT